MKDIQTRIIANREVAAGTYLIHLAGDMPEFIPGQFVMLKIESGRDPYLRRPLGILEYSNGVLRLLYKIKGEGTTRLARMTEGESVGILGPQGNGFSLPDKTEGKAVLIAGGTGLPPVLALAGRVGRHTLLFGARSESDIPFECLEREVVIATQDGSHGEKGLVTDLLGDALTPDTKIIYACGPFGMLQAVAQAAKEKGLACEVCLEERMACGFGVCSGCVVQTTAGNKRVCVDGPVFDAADIVW